MTKKDDFESILVKSEKAKLNRFYKNLKQLTTVEHKKSNYQDKLLAILTLFDDIEQNPRSNYKEFTKHFTLNDYKTIFGDFRQTLMKGRSKKSKVSNLLTFKNKTNALKRYYFEFN